jgi:sigma-B regulation protein RsbU (phosphoserine phosphatase)
MARTPEAEILVVDDDAVSRRLLLRILTASGYACREASNGRDALEMLQGEPPSLLILDFDMPGINGAEVLRKLRLMHDITIARTPTIMLTGHGSDESEVLCLQAGADDFVTKPLHPEVLRARIETQLRLRSMRTQLEEQNRELEAWRKNLERDLAAAQSTQRSLIPQKPIALPGWDVAACYRPVIEVGGDIYGWLPMRDGRVLFWIADATGHGASAALLTTLAKLLFHHSSVDYAEPAEIMQAVDRDFRGIFGARSFMTAMCVALDVNSGAATVVGAGHPPLLVARKDGAVERYASSAPPLGVVQSSQFHAEEITMHAGDTFVLYTDGMYGRANDAAPHLSQCARAERADAAPGSAESLLNCMMSGANGHDPAHADDIAAVAVRRRNGASPKI